MSAQNLISDAVRSLSSLLTSRLASADSKLQKSAVTLAYWIKDYVRLLGKEINAPHTYRRYKRGCVVSVHLGFRIGHEEGGFMAFTVPLISIVKPLPVLSSACHRMSA